MPQNNSAGLAPGAAPDHRAARMRYSTGKRLPFGSASGYKRKEYGMENIGSPANQSAARITASTFGSLCGLGGITHGIGELLQGNTAPGGVIFNSWTQGPIAANMGGEPAMTVVPNLFVTGLLTILFSLATIAWSVFFVRRRRGGLVLILLSIAMLLVGAGFAPPVMGILAGVAGLGIHARSWKGVRLPTNLQHFLAQSWPWLYGIGLANGVLLVVGSVILVYSFGLNNPDLFVYSFFVAIVLLILCIITGAAYDVHKGYRAGLT